MDYKKMALNDLKDYNKVKTGISNLIDRIHELEEGIDGVNVQQFTSDRVQSCSGDNPEERRIVDAMAELNELRPRLDYSIAKNKRIDKALSMLTEQQRSILDRFHINKTENHVQILCAELGYEKSNIYNFYNEAMRDFTIAMYSIVDA